MTLFTRNDTVGSNLLYKGQIINLRVDEVLSGGKSAIREVVEHNGGVVIVCQPEPDHVILVKQYRYALNREIVELPAGRLNKGEVPISAAKRELKEETGYELGNWKQLGAMYSAPGFCDELLYLFHADNCTEGNKALDDDEETEVLCLTVKEAWRKVKEGQIVDAKTIAGLAMII